MSATDTTYQRPGYFGIRGFQGIALDYAGFTCSTDGKPGWN